MTKPQKIQESYWGHWEAVKNLVDKDGWVNLLDTSFLNPRSGIKGLEMETANEYDPKYCYYKRPKSLKGIEDNNGWNRFEDKLPNKEMVCMIVILRTYLPKNLKVFTTTTISTFDYHEEPDLYKRYSHWKYKEQDEPPLY